MGTGTIRIVLLLTAALSLHAELKIRPLTDGKTSRTAAAREVAPGVRRHYLVANDRLPAVLDGGAAVVAYLPATGYIVSAESTSINAQVIDPASKLSSDLSDASTRFFLVEFFPDTTAADEEALVRAAGFIVYARPDLAPNQLLVEGDRARLPELARADEVAYIFPASTDLVRGEPVYACLNSATGTPGAGQYIATYGDGWDGPGRGAAALTYSFQSLTQKVPAEQAKEIFERAMAEWAKYAAVRFSPTNAIYAPRNINVLFAAKDHHDNLPFDGPGGVLAHTFLPNPPNLEPFAGDMHLDAEENWHVGVDKDLFSVVLHELGHALGLGHADTPNSVMYPYYRRVTALGIADIWAIQGLYAAPVEAASIVAPLQFAAPASFTTTASSVLVQGSVSGGSGDVRVAWSTDRGQSGTADGGRQWSIRALPLSVGANQLNLIATDAAGTTATAKLVITRAVEKQAPAKPEIRVTGNIVSGGNTRTISGTAAHPAGIRHVVWAIAGGAKGVASGTATWTASFASPSAAVTVRFSAFANDGTEASVDVSLTPASARDVTPPTVTIAAPIGTALSTRLDTIAISGAASDNSGVVQVKWSTNTGLSGVAAGTSSWKIDSVPLYVGFNVVTIRAVDAAGNTGWRSIAVTRTK